MGPGIRSRQRQRRQLLVRNRRTVRHPQHRRQAPQAGQIAADHYRAGRTVDAINMKFQGDRSAFTRTKNGGNLAANYNGKRFKACQKISDEERSRILAQCKPRSAEEEAWNNAASLEAVVAFYSQDPMKSERTRDPVVQRVLRRIDAYSMGSNWADEDESSCDEMDF